MSNNNIDRVLVEPEDCIETYPCKHEVILQDGTTKIWDAVEIMENLISQGKDIST